MITYDQEQAFIYYYVDLKHSRSTACRYAGITMGQAGNIIKKNQIPRQSRINPLKFMSPEEILELRDKHTLQDIMKMYRLSYHAVTDCIRSATIEFNPTPKKYITDIFNPDRSVEDIEARLLKERK